MLPKEIIDFVNIQLPIILRDAENSSGYYFYRESGLNPEQWEALTTTLLKYELATKPVGGSLKLTAEGKEVAAAGPNGYKRFAKKKEQTANDPLTTNRFTRWGVVISGLLSLGALGISWLAYKKPDDNAVAIQKLREERVVDSVKTTRLSARIDSLAHSSEGTSPAPTAKPSPISTNAKKQVHRPTPPPASARAGRRASTH